MGIVISLSDYRANRNTTTDDQPIPPGGNAQSLDTITAKAA